ncbi:MAG: hypothetical protein MUE73_17880 [Planctomycetes bacterium]|jgi:hypothetical protein|nr:hypothetical protein [Planctomycetota bacterium]
MRARRILILSVDKGLAETLCRGLRGLRDPPVEIDVALTTGAALDRIRAGRVDLLIAGLPGGVGGDAIPPLPGGVPEGIPLLIVGGTPEDRPEGSVREWRVPLPLSFRLLEVVVRRVLGRPRPPGAVGTDQDPVTNVAD